MNNKIISIQYMKDKKSAYVTRQQTDESTMIRVYHRPSVYTLDRIRELAYRQLKARQHSN